MKVHTVKAMVSPVVMYGCESWTIKKADYRIDTFKLWCWRRLLRVPWTARRSNQSILKEINPKYSLEGLMLKLKLQNFGHLMVKSWLIGKDPDARKYWGQEKGTTEDEMVGWHHWLNGHEFEQTLGDGERQGSLACYSPWGCKELDMTEWLKNNQKKNIIRKDCAVQSIRGASVQGRAKIRVVIQRTSMHILKCSSGLHPSWLSRQHRVTITDKASMCCCLSVYDIMKRRHRLDLMEGFKLQQWQIKLLVQDHFY